MTKSNVGKKIIHFLSNSCYEILLISLFFHLYGSIFFNDLHFYGTYIRIINTIFLYFASTNSFFHRKNTISKRSIILIIITLILNLIFLFKNNNLIIKEIREFYVLIFMILTLYNTAKFLLMPNRFDKALISASVVGYMLIIEVAVRVFLILFLISDKPVLNNIDFSFHTNTFIDTVYYCTITITSIGYGDILPISHNARMTTSLLGLIGQLYLVVIMSIMVSKFLSKKKY